ncbi:MAG: hypothetical protein R3F51_08625, partial [Cyanobacteriota/Melainabacteria group bacterium]
QGLILKVRLPGILQGLKLRGTSRCYLLYMLSIKDKKTWFFLVADVLALVLAEMETANRVYLSYLDPRVKELPDEAAQGCPFLPGSNLFNLFK